MSYNEDRFNQFIQRWMGETKADWDGWYEGQCVDLFRYFCDEVMQIDQPLPVWGAANFWTNFTSDPVLVEHFNRVPNTDDFIPIKGDTMIWDFDAGGGYGHVGMVSDNKGTLTYFNSFDQNWSRVNLCEIVKHNYINVYGVLRPKKGDDNMSDTITIEKKTFEELVTKSTKYDEFVKIGYDEPYKVEELENKLKETEKARDKAIQQKTELQEQIKNHECPVIPNPEPTPEKKHVEQHVKYEKDGKTYTDIYLVNQ